jgi:hypothetical protein
MASDIPLMKAAMSDDGGDSIEEQIQAHYQKFQREPGNPRHAFAIGNLYEKRNEYANAVPWLQHAFDVGGQVDGTLETRILDLRLRSLKQQISEFRAELEAEDDPESQAEFRAKIDGLLEELQDALLLQKKRKDDFGPGK